MSHKKQAMFYEFTRHEGFKWFHLTRVIPNRWVSSTHRAWGRFYHNYPAIVGHMNAMLDNGDTGAKTQKHLDFFTTREVMSTMVYTLDLMESFKYASEKFQSDGESLISQGRIRRKLEETMNYVAFQVGPHTKKFLLECQCQNGTIPSQPCVDVETYENSDKVTFHGIELKVNDNYEKLSSIQESYVTFLLDSLEEYFPQSQSNLFSIFDQRDWTFFTDRNAVLVQMKAIANIWKKHDAETLTHEFLGFVAKIKENDDIWLTTKGSLPHLFWANILDNYEFNDNQSMLMDLIKMIITIPMGSASAERSFSHMNFIKNSRNAGLGDKMLRAFMQIKMNGPPINFVNFEEYTIKYLSEGHVPCDGMNTGNIKRQKKNDAELDNFSGIYV